MEQHDAQGGVGESRANYRDYALKVFEIHAAQRMQSFRFYLILAVAIGGGLTQVDLEKEGGAWVALGVLLTVFSVVFRILEWRTRDLVKISEKALILLDRQEFGSTGTPSPLAIFSRTDYLSKRKRRKWVSYRYMLCVMFWLGGVVGIGVALIGLLHWVANLCSGTTP